ncbi:MAG: O-antigen ligase family protein [Candidatus Omnitrophota bacterium]
MKKISETIFLVIFILFFIWISFFSSLIQPKYIVIILFFGFISIIFLDKINIKRLFIDKNDLFLWSYIFILTIGLNFAQNRDIAINKYYDYAIPALVVYFFFKSNIYLFKNKNEVALTICILGAIVGFIGILEHIFHRNLIYEIFIKNQYYIYYLSQGRVMSTQYVPQVFGTYLAASSPFACFLAFNANKKSLILIGIFCWLFILVGAFLSLERVAICAFTAATFIYLVFKNKKIALIFLLFIFSLLLVFSSSKDINKQRISIGRYGFFNKEYHKYRITRFEIAGTIARHNIIWGVGLGNYKIVFNKYDKEPKEHNEYRKTPENMFLMMLCESGVLGLLSFIGFLFLIISRALPMIRMSSKYKEVISIALGGMVAILVTMMTYDSLYWRTPYFMFWFYCGIIMSLTGREENVENI